MKATPRHDLHGLLVVDKPRGLTSYDVIRRVKHAARLGKIGHTGTLDPMATGVLPLVLGRATKLVPFLQAGRKVYQGRILLGRTTDTDDVTGETLSEKTGFQVDLDQACRAALNLVGEIEQAPPAYSALKFNGRPAYELARSGCEVPVRLRKVTVHQLILTGLEDNLISFRAEVSKGTYLRSLAADLGRLLGTGACLESLRRLTSEPFREDQARSLPEIEDLAAAGRLGEIVLTLDEAVSFMPALNLPADLEEKVRHGQSLPVNTLEGFRGGPGPLRLHGPQGDLLAIYEYNPAAGTGAGEALKPLRVLRGS